MEIKRTKAVISSLYPPTSALSQWPQGAKVNDTFVKNVNDLGKLQNVR